MQRLPPRPNLDHLRKQAKDLLASARTGDPGALARLRTSVPGLAGEPRLRDAQSCVARGHGFPSWTELKRFVAASTAGDRTGAFLRLAYAGDTAGSLDRPSHAGAARLLAENPGLAGSDPFLACAAGDEPTLRRVIPGDPGWVNRPGGPLELPPLVAVTHSALGRRPGYRTRLRACARLLLRSGADPNASVPNRWPGTAPDAPRLTALYGAAGLNQDPEMTQLLLHAGADPNDGESLYHSLENPLCTKLLLDAGAPVAGTNALYRALDFANPAPLRLLLAAGADPNEAATGSPASDWRAPLLWAIRRRRSPAHMAALIGAGADPAVQLADGTGAYALALRYGLPEVADILQRIGCAEALSEDDRFVAACAAADEDAARLVLARRPDLPGALADAQLRLLPELAALGRTDAVRLMVRLGWPVAVRGGDWDASALNHAVFRGDAALTRFLLEHGARWTERHGFGDDVCGTLSWATANEPDHAEGDWLGCAAALRAHGMPAAQPGGTGGVLVDGRPRQFSPEVAEFLLGADVQRATAAPPR